MKKEDFISTIKVTPPNFTQSNKKHPSGTGKSRTAREKTTINNFKSTIKVPLPNFTQSDTEQPSGTGESRTAGGRE